MLTELHIYDFAIIDELHLTFAPGFIAFTGETGAGKSIIIDAMGLILGGRADTTFVRSQANRALVEAVFALEPHLQRTISPLLEKEGLEGDEPNLLLLSREIRTEGRNVCRVNGRTVTLSLLQEVAEGLVDIHGQSEHLSLLRVREHINLLDRYGDLWGQRERVAGLVARVRALRQEREALERDEQELARRMDLLQYQIGEIEAASLTPGEEIELGEEQVRLANAEQLAGLLTETLQALSEGSEEASAAIDLLGSAVRTLERLAHIDSTLAPQLRDVEELTYRAQDLADTLRAYQQQVEYNPRRLAQVEERINLVRRLQRKYGGTIPDVLAFARKAAAEMEAITHSEERIAELHAEEEQTLAKLAAAAVDLSLRRREAAETLSQSIEVELQDLRMDGARFGVDFQWRDDPAGAPLDGSLEPDAALESAASDVPSGRAAFDRSGIDRVEFLVSPNPGEPLKPLAKIASGGETSRLMLALKAVLSRADETPTLVFDEIDQGIGGRVGAVVGEKLWALTSAQEESDVAHQVLCITHLPQLAGYGDAHFKVDKTIVEGRTVTRVIPLRDAGQVEELAQMLGSSGEAAYRSAEEILEQVTDFKFRKRQ